MQLTSSRKGFSGRFQGNLHYTIGPILVLWRWCPYKLVFSQYIHYFKFSWILTYILCLIVVFVCYLSCPDFSELHWSLVTSVTLVTLLDIWYLVSGIWHIIKFVILKCLFRAWPESKPCISRPFGETTQGDWICQVKEGWEAQGKRLERTSDHMVSHTSSQVTHPNSKWKSGNPTRASLSSTPVCNSSSCAAWATIPTSRPSGFPINPPACNPTVLSEAAIRTGGCQGRGSHRPKCEVMCKAAGS